MSSASGILTDARPILGQAWAVALHEVRRLLRARHAIPRFGLLFLPLVMAVVVAAVRIAMAKAAFTDELDVFGHVVTAKGEQRVLANVFRMGHLRWIVFLAAAGIFGGLFSGERSERTLHHLFLQPLRRETLTLGKYLGGVLVLWSGAFAAWMLTTIVWLLPHGSAAFGAMLSLQGLGDSFLYALILLLGVVAYGGLFLLAGAFVRSPALVALALLAWEGVCLFLPVTFQRLTVFYWLDSLSPVRAPGNSALAVLAEPAPWPLSILVCLVIGAVGVAGAAWRARSMELDYGASE